MVLLYTALLSHARCLWVCAKGNQVVFSSSNGGSTLGPGGTGPHILPRPPTFLDTVVLLLVELIGSIVNFA